MSLRELAALLFVALWILAVWSWGPYLIDPTVPPASLVALAFLALVFAIWFYGPSFSLALLYFLLLIVAILVASIWIRRKQQP